MFGLLAIVLLTQLGTLPVERGTLSIQGTVRDSMGRPFPAATVWVKDESNDLPRSTSTDVLGRYTLSYLWPGKYVIFAEAPDFAKEQRIVDVTGTSRVDITLKVITLGTCPGPDCISLQPIPDDPTLAANIEAARKRRLSAERLVSELWQFTLSREDIEKASDGDSRLRRILLGLRELGTDAVATLALGLRDRDVHVRRNSCLILLELSSGSSAQGRGGLDVSEALPALRFSLQDSDVNVRNLARQASDNINR